MVVETGMRTQLGHIAHMIQSADDLGPTPLQRRMARLGLALAVVALVIVGLVFVLGLLRGEEVRSADPDLRGDGRGGRSRRAAGGCDDRAGAGRAAHARRRTR